MAARRRGVWTTTGGPTKSWSPAIKAKGAKDAGGGRVLAHGQPPRRAPPERPAAPATAGAGAGDPGVRVELFFKSDSELRTRVRELTRAGITSFNLCNKCKNDDLAGWLDTVLDAAPGATVCVHYSLKFQKPASGGRGGDVAKRDDATFGRFVDTVAELSRRAGSGAGKLEVLALTGSGPKPSLDSVRCLQRLGQHRRMFGAGAAASAKPRTEVGVAFNPYFPDNGEAQRERGRCRRKLETGEVDAVWLQFGTDTTKLVVALEWLQSLQPTLQPTTIVGALFLPTRQLIAQQKFRPWNGVWLSEAYLSGPEAAEAATLELLEVYRRYGVQVLVEAPGVRAEKDLELLRKLGVLPSPRTPSPRATQAFGLAPAATRPREQPATPPATRQASPAVTVVSESKRRRCAALPQQLVSVVLFRSTDLRLHDNPALAAGCKRGAVVPAYIWSEPGEWGVRGAMQVYVKESLRSLAASLERIGLKLVLRQAPAGSSPAAEAAALCREAAATALYYNREYLPEDHEADRALQLALNGTNVESRSFCAALLYEPEQVALRAGFSGGHWGTLMPFVRACQSLGPPPSCLPAPTAATASAPASWPTTLALDELTLASMPRRKDGSVVDWGVGIRARWTAGEEAALEAADRFVAGAGLAGYEKHRSRADLETATARVSAHLRVGELSPRYLYHAVRSRGFPKEVTKTFGRRLHWRDLAYYHLHTFPLMRTVSIRQHYDHTRWVQGEAYAARLRAWQKGRTGFPMVDAGMRELYATGWMCQSVRMIVASFLIEYLRVSWVEGERWFHDTLIDADAAINAMMWQNAGRSGIDQWNFVMSPENGSQDPTGVYTRRWVPELARLPNKHVHTPWRAPASVLADAGVELGIDYPHRVVVDLKAERRLSVAAVLKMRRASQQWNDDGGYDLVKLPNGQSTRVFTKQEYRITKAGARIPVKTGGRGLGRGSGGRGRGGKRAAGGPAGRGKSLVDLLAPG